MLKSLCCCSVPLQEGLEAAGVVVPLVVGAEVDRAEAASRKRKGSNNGLVKYYLFTFMTWVCTAARVLPLWQPSLPTQH